MSGRRRQSLSPSLFPFLAVLVCTLGTLILFLALVAQNATTAAERNAEAKRVAQAKLQAAEAEQPKPPRLTAAAVQSMLEEEQFRVTQLVAFRDKQTADLEARRDQLTHIEDHQQRLRQTLRRLSDEVENAMGDAKIEVIDDQTIANTRQRLEAERSLVEKLRSESADKIPRVVIVPHKGPNGTDRRPVYLECTDQGVTIWPEGSHITMTQLEDANHSANPLDAALRVIRLHTMKNYGDTTPPYPLLVVRPDGIETYAAARGAMQDWDDQFGYELVPADVKLAFSQPDSNLKQRVDLAIREEAAKQHAQNAIARRAVGRGGGFSGSGDLRDGGRSSRLPTLSAASLDRAGRAGGFRSHRDSSQYQRSPYTSGSDYSAGGQYDSSSGARSQYNSFGGSSYPADDAGAAARKWAAEMKTAAEEMRNSQDADGTAGIGGAGFGDANVGESGITEPGAQTTEPGERATPAGPSYSLPNQYAAENATGESSDGDRSDGDPSDDEGSGNSDDGSAASETGQSTSSSASPPSQSTSASGPAPGGPQSSGSATPSSSLSMPQPGSAASSDQAASSAPPTTLASGAPKSELVRREGRDWALPPNMVGIGGNTVIRTIRVQCYQDRFLLLPSASGGASGAFEFTSVNSGDIEQATLRLATAVRDRVALWGPALTGGRWQPRLDVIVMPGGETRFHQLRTLMIGSGVEVSGRASR